MELCLRATTEKGLTDGELTAAAERPCAAHPAKNVLLLPPGETTIFAQIDTDMRLTALPFEIAFDASLGVLPA